MIKVKKREGNIVEFDIHKIESAITKAFVACGINYNSQIIELIALKASADFNKKIKNDVVSVEDIQDSVEISLIQAGYVEVAKAYIKYRQQHVKC